MKRACLFVGYDRHNLIDDYVVYYIQALAKFADVYYFADNDMAASELDKLRSCTVFAAARKHGRYDFGSWGELIKLIGWEKLETYDRVLLVNDSGYGPLFKLNKMFAEMDVLPVDAWSMCGNKFMMSFFMSFTTQIIRNPAFRYLFENIEEVENKNIVVHKYERGLSRLISEQGFSTAFYISPQKVQKYFKENRRLIQQRLAKIVPWTQRFFIRLRPNKVRLYSEDYVVLTMMGMPVLKTMFFKVADNIAANYWQDLISCEDTYPRHLIANHLERMQIMVGRSGRQSVKCKIREALHHFFFEYKIKKNRLITKICKIPVRWVVVTSDIEMNNADRDAS